MKGRHMKLSVQFRSQAVRFLRVFVVTVGGTLLATGANYDRAAIVAAVVAAVETAVRAVWPAAPLGAVQGVLGSGAAKLLNVPKPPAAPPAA